VGGKEFIEDFQTVLATNLSFFRFEPLGLRGGDLEMDGKQAV